MSFLLSSAKIRMSLYFQCLFEELEDMYMGETKVKVNSSQQSEKRKVMKFSFVLFC